MALSINGFFKPCLNKDGNVVFYKLNDDNKSELISVASYGVRLKDGRTLQEAIDELYNIYNKVKESQLPLRNELLTLRGVY